MRIIIVFLFNMTCGFIAAADAPTIIAGDLQLPAYPCYGPNGVLYCTEFGKVGQDGTGRIIRIEDGKAVTFVKDLQHPRGMVYSAVRKAFYVADEKQILKVDDKGKVTVLVAADKFPATLSFLNCVSLDEQSQTLLTCAVSGAGIYRINLKTNAVEEIVNPKSHPEFKGFLAVIFDGASHCICESGGKLYRINLATKAVTAVGGQFSGANGLCWDKFGRLFIFEIGGSISVIPRPGVEPLKILTGLSGNMWGGCVDATGQSLIYANNNLMKLPITIPGWDVDETPLPVEAKPAFPKLKWTGWDDGSDTGKVGSHRPIIMLPAPDGSNRNVVALQQGTIHIFDNTDDVATTKVMLNLTPKVKYLDKQNEEGLLGIAFHPKFKTNREVFLFYTDTAAKMTNVVSRFKMKANDADVIDPASEQVLLKIEKPYWNHDGGTIVFGPDGYLYITHGDGGLGNDPHENGQNLNTHLGKILRIDVDKKADGREYAIPVDNPFLKNTNAKPEVFAYGFRNIWRMSFDKADGTLWAADVGQNLFEEINIVKAGGNYGWSVREGLHPFGAKGQGPSNDVIDPIWEYHHDIGKSITGGDVYHGTAIPEMKGMYLYADYVTPKIWALKYDAAKKRVTANKPIGLNALAVMSFGEDAKGEAYVLGATPNAKGILRLTKK